MSFVIRYMCLWMQYHDDKARVKDTMKAGKVGHCCIFFSFCELISILITRRSNLD